MARFSPPGDLHDLTNVTHLQEWSDTIGGLVDGLAADSPQFFNPITSPRADLSPRRIPWMAVPQTVWDHRPRADARTQADDPANRVDASSGQNEYAEWFTLRDPGDDEVIQVDVATELREYYTFLDDKLTDAEFLAVYQQLYPAATNAALRIGTAYNQLNPFNTTRGAVHLIGAINTLSAAIGVVSGALPWRFNSAGRVIDVQDCGNPDTPFHADPSIVTNINRMAREGRAITFADPFGIYIFDIDTSGWRCPDGSNPRSLITFSRGTPPQHARVTVPPGRGFRLCDVRIAGEPIRSGSQIAERTTVGIVMAVGPPGELTFTTGITCVDSAELVAPTPAALIIEETFVTFRRR